MFDNLTDTQMTWLFSIIGAGLLLTVLCMIDIYRRHGRDPMKMMIWLQVSIIPFFGALAYLLKGRTTQESEK